MGRKPDYTLKLMVKDGEARTNRAGVAWENSSGTIQITLDPGIVLDWRDDIYITLFPNGEGSS